ncbi:hypothetical protein K505DRAFT_355013 [Melanomma pulvis-pyrius CBS 109.77]|uniref:Lysine-specific metallo-endopeptidase domain-containing protein n=1 Tax=Melanomma pulvis-pyrius CBS 109.77 TaxID=1314802 RepID=A0A6A6XXA6_9PLEO|nr:hypothetical protein K505DRAFT_355013 [Melanomma pulvis-pyrius CBS 109.77]
MLLGKYSLRAACLAFFFSSTVAVDHTWWIDQSCNGKLDNAVPEAFETAKIIRERLPADPNAAPGSPAASAFQALFSRDAFWYLSASYTEQLDRLFGDYTHSLQKFSVNTDSQFDAEIRIYCDDDARWEVRRDDPKQSEGSLNSQRGEKDKEWIDALNQIVIKGTPACKVEGTTTGAVTYVNGPGRIRTLEGDIPKKKLLSKNVDKTIDQLREVTSMVILHELFHHSRYNKKDLPENSEEAYKWANCIKKDEKTAADNADNWMLLGLLVRLLDRQFHLDPSDTKSGKLVLDKNIPARNGVTVRSIYDVLANKPRELLCENEVGNSTEAGYTCQEFAA